MGRNRFENVGGRHIGFGDGVYKSEDGGTTWKNMGLKKSEHISKIIVHPKDPNIIGWRLSHSGVKAVKRGLYKSMDGGKVWVKTLGDDKWTGVTDMVIDPRNPDQMYAATWQRHRTVAAYMEVVRARHFGAVATAVKPGKNLNKVYLLLIWEKLALLFHLSNLMYFMQLLNLTAERRILSVCRQRCKLDQTI